MPQAFIDKRAIIVGHCSACGNFVFKRYRRYWWLCNCAMTRPVTVKTHGSATVKMEPPVYDPNS